MKVITTRDLRESLTHLYLYNHDDGEGGWCEEWRQGQRVWGALWPLHMHDAPGYRIVIRANLSLPSKVAFLWNRREKSKRLLVVSPPLLIQCNRFLSMIAREEFNA
jgi:hypothetical protein